MMRLLLLLVAGLLVAGCESTSYTRRDGVITIHNGTGGLVYPIQRRYAQWSREGLSLVIAGQVVSADAIEAFSYPGACYTGRAIFSPHAYADARWLGLRRLAGFTERAADKLPESLGDWFRNDMSFYDPIGFAYVEYEQLLTIWPEGACNQDDVEKIS